MSSKDPWYDQVTDQLLHVLLGAFMTLPLLLLPYAGWRTYVAAILITFVGGVYREVTQMMKAKRDWYWDRTLDSAMHLPGGIMSAFASSFVG